MFKNVMLSLLLVCMLAVCSAQATVVFSDGFEGYSAGAVLPQSAIPPVGMQWYDLYSPSNDLIVTDIVKDGDQALKMMRNGSGQSALIAMGLNNSLADGLELTIKQDVYLPWWDGTVGGSCENYFGAGTAQEAGWSINGAAQIAYYQDGVVTSTGVGAERNAWNTYTMVFHLVSQGDTAFNGTWDFYVSDSVGTTYISETGLTLGTFDLGDAIPRLYMYASSTWGNDVVYYDNISMEVIPEPATMVLLGFGALGLLRKRKRA